MAKKKYDPTLCDGAKMWRVSYCDLLIEHFAKGGSFRSFAGIVKVSYQTLFYWLKEHPEFSETKKRYEPTAHLWWEEVGRKSLFLKNDVRFNTHVYSFFMSRLLGPPIEAMAPEELQDPYKLTFEELTNVIETAEEALQYLKSVQADRHGLIQDDPDAIHVEPNKIEAKNE